MRYRLRTLLIALAVGPVVLAGSYGIVRKWQKDRAEAEAREAYDRGCVQLPSQTVSPLP